MENKNTFDKAFNQLEAAQKQIAEENKMLAKLKTEGQEEKHDIETLEDEVKNQERLLAPLKEQIMQCQEEREKFEEDFARKEAELKARYEAKRADLEARWTQSDKETSAREREVLEANRALKDTIGQKEKELGEIRGLLLRMKEESETNFGKAVLKEREWTEMKKELDNAKSYIETLHNELKEKEQAILSAENDMRAKLTEGARADLGLTSKADKVHALLENERKEFNEHYTALEKEFEAKEKELLNELRTLKEADTKKSMEFERMNMELAEAREKQKAAESKASSASIETMELNVYNKSAAAALRDKDMEISDLKTALEEARAAASKGAGRPG